MRNNDSLNVLEKLLLAALRLEKQNKRPFTAEDLVVSAWENFPNAFGLAGYRDDTGKLLYPDSNRVFAEIMGSKPMRKRGYLVKVGEKLYELTETGREHASLILNRTKGGDIPKASLDRKVELKLKKMLASKAMEKFKSNRFSDITFFDACSFWEISPRSSAIEFEGSIANLHEIIKRATVVVGNRKVSFEHGGETFSSSELDNLMNLHKALIHKFKTEIDIILKRRDER